MRSLLSELGFIITYRAPVIFAAQKSTCPIHSLGLEGWTAELGPIESSGFRATLKAVIGRFGYAVKISPKKIGRVRAGGSKLLRFRGTTGELVSAYRGVPIRGSSRQQRIV